MIAIQALRSLALCFIDEHQGAHLAHDHPLLVDRCVAHLIEIAQVTKDVAEEIALQAMGEVTSHHPGNLISLRSTTPFALFPHDLVTDCPRVVTLADLMTLLGKTDSKPLPGQRTVLVALRLC